MNDLSTAARALAAAPADPEACRAAVRALVAAAESPSLKSWDKAEKTACCWQLILHDPCPEQPPVLAHEMASLISSGNGALVAKLYAELLPILRKLLAAGPGTAPGFKNAVVLLLVLRPYIGQDIPAADITRLHLDWFPHFSFDDLALPYNVMFNQARYDANRDEILSAYAPDDPAVLENPALKPWHLVFFEWLAGRGWFRDADNADLDRFLAARLPGDHPEDIRHARTLVLRHLRPGGRLTADRLTELGLGPVSAMAAEQAQKRADLAATASPAPRAARTLESKPYQAAQVAWSLATSKIPALNRRQRRMRIAVCVSGQLRGYQQALESWRKTLFRNAEPEFFVHSWEGIGRADAHPIRQVLPFAGNSFPGVYREQVSIIGYETALLRYPTLFARLQNSANADRDEVAAVYGTDHVVLEDDRGPDVATLSNQQKMHYKIHAADRMARDTGTFDLFVRLRPDLEVKLAAFDWHDLLAAVRSRPVLYAEKPLGQQYGNLLMGDQCAIAAPEVMEVYAGTWKSFPALAAADLGRCPDEFTGHVSLGLTCWYHGIDVKRTPLRFGQLLEAERLPSVEIRDALEQDLSGRSPDAADTALMAAVRSDLNSSPG